MQEKSWTNQSIVDLPLCASLLWALWPSPLGLPAVVARARTLVAVGARWHAQALGAERQARLVLRSMAAKLPPKAWLRNEMCRSARFRVSWVVS